MRTLRSQFILSHLLPLLIIVPLVGIALVYVLESQILLPNLATSLVRQATLMTDLLNTQPEIWDNPTQAQAFANRMGQRLGVQVMLLNTSGYILASSDPADALQSDQPVPIPNLASLLAEGSVEQLDYSLNLETEVADVFVPVVGADQQVVGLVRLTHNLASAYERFLRLRTVILGVLAGGLGLGAVIGLIFALDLERPLRRLTRAVNQLARGQRSQPLPEEGPEEVRLLLTAFNGLVERLRSLESTRRQLLANLVHELGRPLGALQAATQALLSGADQDPELRRELLGGMQAEIQRLRPLLENLAQLHSQVLGPLEIDRQPTALSKWLPPVVNAWREAAREKELDWSVSIPANLPVVALDANQLGRAVGNLLSNAIKYTMPGGRVSVAAGVETESVWMRVVDSGLGIAPEEQELIFRPFYRSHTNRRFPQGMGLGLTIARELVVAHGGQLTLDSTPGQGSTFTIRLPLTTATGSLGPPLSTTSGG